MIDLVIVEDEAPTRSFLKALVMENTSGINIVGEADSVASGLEAIQRLQPELIFLDVEMGDGTGFDLLRQLEEDPPFVIFITAFDHYAVQALRAGAIDYLEKPVNPLEFNEAIASVKQRIAKESKTEYGELLHSVRGRIHGRVALPTRNGATYIEADEVIYIKADSTYAEFHLETSKKPLVISRNLKQILPALDHLGFLRPHRSYLINASKIKEVNRTDGGSLVMSNGVTIPFSKQYKEQALEQIRRMTVFL